MKMENTLFKKLAQYDFSQMDQNTCFGVWDDYAITLGRSMGRTYFVYVAIRVHQAKLRLKLKRPITKAMKEAGITKANVMMITENFLKISMTVGKEDTELQDARQYLSALTGVLRQNQVFPANTCALTGKEAPDSLCLMASPKYFGFQPVFASAVQQSSYTTRAKAEENELNGSYLTGTVGAVVGAVLGMIPNLLLMIFAHRIVAVLFMLVPLGAMFGYRLLRGKNNWVSIVLAVVLSLLSVPVMEFFYVAISVAKEYELPFDMAVEEIWKVFFETEILEHSIPQMLQMTLYMAVGVALGWSYMKRSLNNTQAQGAKLQLDSLRVNPNRKLG